MVLNITCPETMAAQVRAPDAWRSEEKVDQAKVKITSELSGRPASEIRDAVRLARADIARREAELEKTKAKHRRLGQAILSYEDVDEWAKGFLVFEKPAPGAAESLKAGLLDQSVFSQHELLRGGALPSFDGLFDEGKVFRIEHDWHKALHKSGEYESGSFRLPFDVSIFEFLISRRRVVAMCLNAASVASENEIIMQIAVEGLAGWFLSGNIFRHVGGWWDVIQSGQSIEDDRLRRAVYLIGNQIRAACVALDAEVATVELAREAHVGNRERREPRVGYSSYTISLAAKSRAASLASLASDPPQTKRLHFRRGHWRHYASHKTWIRWMLVGNPDLGFIDKKYRF